MAVYVIRVPDIGEGIAETELAEWLVKVGDLIAEDQPVAAVMTDKATVEIPSPVHGRVLALGAAPGEIMAVGGELLRLDVEGAGNLAAAPEVHAAAPPPPAPEPEPAPAPAPKAAAQPPRAAPAPVSGPLPAPLAAPTVRALAQARGVDLRHIRGTGPEGRILREDVEGYDPGAATALGPRANPSWEDVPVIGLRRRISQRMEQANRIPHITIVEEVQVQALEALRSTLNTRPGRAPDQPKLTLLPFLARAVVQAVAEQPVMNAHYDSESGMLRKFGGVHLGIAAQTAQGLVVPVLRHAEARSLGDSAREIARLAEAAREGRASREELSGSTITLSSLGPLGALATTPILNAPEVAIIGVNRMAIRPHWNGTGFEPRQMMNISCSFDHRVIDGWDAAVFVQRLKELLETPALLFVEV